MAKAKRKRNRKASLKPQVVQGTADRWERRRLVAGWTLLAALDVLLALLIASLWMRG